jgi:hypothetical protein
MRLRLALPIAALTLMLHCGVDHAAAADAPYGLCIVQDFGGGYYAAFLGADSPTGEFEVQGFKFTALPREVWPRVGDCGRAFAFPDHSSREHVHGAAERGIAHFHAALTWQQVSEDDAMQSPNGTFTYCDGEDDSQCLTNSTPSAQGGTDWKPIASHGEGLDPATEPVVEDEERGCDYGLDSETKCLDGRTDTEPAGGTD